MFQQFLQGGVNRGKRLDREKAREHYETVALVPECKAGLRSHLGWVTGMGNCSPEFMSK